MGKLENHFDPEYLELLDSGTAKWIIFCNKNKDFEGIAEDLIGLDIDSFKKYLILKDEPKRLHREMEELKKDREMMEE
jgi:hypothetical protein